MDSLVEPGQLVRSYSIELESNIPPNVPANDLRRVLIENERRISREEEESASWRKYYEPWNPQGENTDPRSRIVREQAVKLSHAWKDFRASLSKDEQEQLEGKKPSVEGLISMVNTVANEWQSQGMTSKSGRFMNNFTSFCETLKAHSSLLEILPEGNEYVSLFTGTLKTIINASSNYKKISTGLGKALSKISVHVIACEREVGLYCTKGMQEKVALLYAHIFLFLQDTMKWYQKKPKYKIQDALRENFYEHFEDIILNIERLSRDVLREANLSSMAETRQIGLTADRTLEQVRTGQFDARLSMDRVSQEQAEVKYQLEQLRLDLQGYGEEVRQLALNRAQRIEEFDRKLFFGIRIGSSARQQLLWDAERDADDRRSRSVGQAPTVLSGIKTMGNNPGAACYERDTIILNSNHLLDTFSPLSASSPLLPPYVPISLDTIAASRLKEWTQDSKKYFLSIAGPRRKGLESPPMTVLASMCIDFATTAKLPVISYFCTLPRETELREGNTREVQALLSLTYALIRQLIEQLPVQFSSEFDFAKERIALLDGALGSWKNTSGLLCDLLEAAPKPLFCVINDFQVLDSWSTGRLIGDLFKALRGSETKDVETERIKVLITTTGKSSALTKHLKAEEMVLADRDGAVDSPSRKGGNTPLIL